MTQGQFDRWVVELLRSGRLYPYITEAEANSQAAVLRGQGISVRVYLIRDWAAD